MEKSDVVKYILRNTHQNPVVNASGCAWAPANIALGKYWGKRNAELNLPVTSSLSLTLGRKGTFTKISHNEKSDRFVVNGEEIALDSPFALRLQKFLNLFRGPQVYYLVETESTVPIASGFASSASGFAALVLALNSLYSWNLPKRELSILARLGSGSACRSLWHGFVKWQAGIMADGMDSYGIPLDITWRKLRLGALQVTNAPKPITSTLAMQITVATSELYRWWPERMERDLQLLETALVQHDFELLGKTAEENAKAMHAMMFEAQPAIIYSLPQTLVLMQKVQELRRAGIPVFFTQDAGANLQLLFLAEDQITIARAFPEIEIIAPFLDHAEQVILVDESDKEVGSADKILAHVQGKLHRAFSVFIFRRHQDCIELLIQQRSLAKYHSGGLWANTCCGHPRPGEEVGMAALRRLNEEMGIDAKLTAVGSFIYRTKLAANLTEYELDHVFIGEMPQQLIAPNEDEVQNYQWIKLENLRYDLMDNSEKYCAWLKPALEIINFKF